VVQRRQARLEPAARDRVELREEKQARELAAHKGLLQWAA